MSDFKTDIRFLKGVGEVRAEYFKSMGIDTVGALLHFYPRGYTDISAAKYISETECGEKVCIKGEIITPVTEKYIRKNMTVYKFVVSDGFDCMTVTVFNNKYLVRKLNVSSTYLFYGKMGDDPYIKIMTSPEIYEENGAGILPIYRAGTQISSKTISSLMKNALKCDMGEDALPEKIRKKYKLCSLYDALNNIHFPKSSEALAQAKRRLVFEELFILKTGLMLLKGKKRKNTSYILKKDYTNEYFGLLPYELTSSQKRAIDDCVTDMASGKAMNRLIQGDVGSGKTAVAAALMFVCAKNGFQSALMAPTEILAEQHYENIMKTFKQSGIRCCLLTGSISKSQKTKIKQALKNGEYDIAVGTHALLTDDVDFNNLGLVITDEQHRFGVNQRAKLASKGQKAHTLVMSATPIPRTLGLIIYGDLDISIIDEYPKGRQKVESYFVDSGYHTRVYNYIKKHIDEGRQGYIVCPLVEESEEENRISAQEYYEKLKSGVFKNYKLGLLHGKMTASEKDKIMRAFKNKEIDLLICTTVIEVGIDVENAAIMVIENAESFGLSQLHQLRGRIGRGKYKSTCIFISDSKSAITKERLNIITRDTDGFRIADEDLRIRGPGDFLGNRQHGLPEFKIADLSSDIEVLKAADMEAAIMLENDPHLNEEENLPLKNEIISLFKRLNEN